MSTTQLLDPPSPAQAAAALLRATLTPDRMLYFIARHTSRSGRQEIGVFLWRPDGTPIDLSEPIAHALNLPLGREHGVVLPGDVIDPPLALSVRLSRVCGFADPLPYSWL